MANTKRTPTVRMEISKNFQFIGIGNPIGNLIIKMQLKVADMNAILAIVTVKEKVQLESMWKSEVKDIIKEFLKNNSSITLEGQSFNFEGSTDYIISGNWYRYTTGGSHVAMKTKIDAGYDPSSYTEVFMVGFDNFY